MRLWLAVTLSFAIGCSDESPASPRDAGPTDAAPIGDAAFGDAAPGARSACLPRPTDLPTAPGAQLPCDLIPPTVVLP